MGDVAARSGLARAQLAAAILAVALGLADLFDFTQRRWGVEGGSWKPSEEGLVAASCLQAWQMARRMARGRDWVLRAETRCICIGI